MTQISNTDMLLEACHLTAKIGLASIPTAGPALSEIFNFLITSPSQKRLESFLEKIYEKLIILENKQKISIDSLKDNPLFQTSIYQAALISPRIHQDEKLNALVNVVINIATDINPDEDLAYIFIELINILTPSHLFILKQFFDNEDKLKDIESYESIFQYFKATTDLVMNRDKFKLLCADLTNRNLIEFSRDIEPFESVYQTTLLATNSKSNAPMLRVTSNGKEFLRFITDLHY